MAKGNNGLLGYMSPALARRGNPSTNDLYWAAGIFEGEGTCRALRTSEAASVCQKDTWLLYKLRDLFGGNVYLRDKNGCSYWQVNGARARGFLQTIYILLSPRRQKQVLETLQRGRGW